ncbi:hypothetical protein M9434_007121 [Picochlorum sp. BPE23]|nr:hypothetical protein M9434_007121 [Picochlorum sp. BPE23]
MVKVFAISDVHTDYKENLAWIESHCQEVRGLDHGQSTSQEEEERVLIVAGDVSDDLDIFRTTFEHLVSAYHHVFFVTGNHELWVRKKDRTRYDSLGKLREIVRICDDLGVKTRPTKVSEQVWIVPMWSWYHASWDKEPDIPGAYPIERVMMDFHACDWSSQPHIRASGDDSLAAYFDGMNGREYAEALDQIKRDRLESGVFVVSFSHFLPHQELLPEKRWLFYPNLAKAAGSDYLARRVEELQPDCHVYGHTHFTQDQKIQGTGTRFVQWPLGYPKEMKRRRNGGLGWSPIMLWDTKDGHSPQRSSYWSDFYRNNDRKAHIVTPAPYVSVKSSSPSSVSMKVHIK